MKIGIFGGTFDPFTKAHLAIVEKVLDEKLVDKVIVLPTVVSWHRKGKYQWLNVDDKLEVITEFIRTSKYQDKIFLDSYELKFITSSIYAKDRRYIHMLSDVTFRYGIDNSYYTIIGTDSMWNFTTWWSYKAILDMSKLIVVTGRDGIELPSETFDAIQMSISDEYSNVSASEIRTKYNNVDEYLNELKLATTKDGCLLSAN